MTTKTEIPAKERTSGIYLSRLIWVTPAAILLASVINIGLYAVAGAFRPEVTAWPGASPAQIIGANMVYLLIGAITLVVVAKVSSKPARQYRIVATIGLIGSLVLPITAGMGYGQPGMPVPSLATVITLSLMHVVSYAISVPLYTRKVLG